MVCNLLMDDFGKCRNARLAQNVSDPGDQCKEQGGMAQHLSLHYAAIPLQKWKLEIQARFPPQHPFSPSMIILDKLFGDWPLSSFTFDIYLGTS